MDEDGECSIWLNAFKKFPGSFNKNAVYDILRDSHLLELRKDEVLNV